MTNQEIKDKAPDGVKMKIDDLVEMLLESEINIDGKTYQVTSVHMKRETTGDAGIEIKLCKVFNIQKHSEP